MAASLNRVILAGNLTRKPELRYTPSGTAVTDIGLAVSDRRKQGNDWIDETVFVDITFWARTAEVVCQYLDKGSNILVEGRLKFDQWEKNGQRQSKLRVTGEKMQMLGGRDGGPSGGGQSGGGRQSAPSHDEYDDVMHGPPSDDEIPF